MKGSISVHTVVMLVIGVIVLGVAIYFLTFVTNFDSFFLSNNQKTLSQYSTCALALCAYGYTSSGDASPEVNQIGCLERDSGECVLTCSQVREKIFSVKDVKSEIRGDNRVYCGEESKIEFEFSDLEFRNAIPLVSGQMDKISNPNWLCKPIKIGNIQLDDILGNVPFVNTADALYHGTDSCIMLAKLSEVPVTTIANLFQPDNDQISELKFDSRKHTYQIGEYIQIRLDNVGEVPALLDISFKDSANMIFLDDDCISINSDSNYIQPNSSVLISWDTEKCDKQISQGSWQIVSRITVNDKLTDWITSIEILLIDPEEYKKKTNNPIDQFLKENNPVIFSKHYLKQEEDDRVWEFNIPHYLKNTKFDDIAYDSCNQGFEISYGSHTNPFIIKIPNALGTYPSITRGYLDTHSPISFFNNTDKFSFEKRITTSYDTSFYIHPNSQPTTLVIYGNPTLGCGSGHSMSFDYVEINDELIPFIYDIDNTDTRLQNLRWNEGNQSLQFQFNTETLSEISFSIPYGYPWSFDQSCNGYDVQVFQNNNLIEQKFTPMNQTRVYTSEIPQGVTDFLVNLISDLNWNVEKKIECFASDNYILDFGFPSPRQQAKYGIMENHITCQEGFELISKSKDDSIACVKPETAEKLIERGWTNQITETIPIELRLSPEECKARGGWYNHCTSCGNETIQCEECTEFCHIE